MGVKESLKNVAGDLGTLSDQYKGLLSPYEETRGWMQNFRNTQLDPFRQQIATAGKPFADMVTDPSKRGYSPEIQKQMLGSQMDVLSGQRRATEQDLSRQRAAAGMGSTGMGMRQAMGLGEQYAGLGRQAARDVSLANAEASRQDLWNAGNYGLQNMGLQQGVLGQSQNLYNQELAALAGEQGVYQGAGQMLANKVPALGAANKAGFWGNFSDVASGISSLIGSGASAYGAYKTP